MADRAAREALAVRAPVGPLALQPRGERGLDVGGARRRRCASALVPATVTCRRLRTPSGPRSSSTRTCQVPGRRPGVMEPLMPWGGWSRGSVVPPGWPARVARSALKGPEVALRRRDCLVKRRQGTRTDTGRNAWPRVRILSSREAARYAPRWRLCGFHWVFACLMLAGVTRLRRWRKVRDTPMRSHASPIGESGVTGEGAWPAGPEA